MRDVELFQQALGLEWPWQVERSEFKPEERRLDIHIRFEVGGTFECPVCKRGGCKAWDTSEKTWRHLNFFQYEAHLHARVPRVKCPEHGVKLVEAPWARPGSGFTLLFEALVLAMVRQMPVNAVARLVGEHDTRIWRVVHHYVDQARTEADFSGVRQVAVDETSSKRGHNYITIFADLEKQRVLFATEGKDARTLGVFRADLEAHGGSAEQISDICMDMSQAFIKGAGEQFPRANITFDKFPLMKLLNEGVDEVRREEQKEHPELKRTRYIWLKNPGRLRRSEAERLRELTPSMLALKTSRAHQIKLSFQELWTLPPDLAEPFLKKWYFWATHSRLPPMVRVAKTIKRHWKGVLRWFESRVNNGIIEGINSLIQAAKAKARGYRSTRNLIAVVYLIAGRLPLRTLPI
jgi:transposase